MPEHFPIESLEHIRRLAERDAPDAELLRRFMGQHDGGAFAALMRRHGPLVLAACRRLLSRREDAEDVFQATFLLLARRASAVRKPSAVAAWLHGVACRLARKARTAAARHHRLAAPPRAVAVRDEPLDRVGASELRDALDEELHRLPDRYRVPLVLCYLQGLTQTAAADTLGWSKGTLRRRLDRGRDVLRARLVGRGLALPAGLGAVALVEATASTAVPAALLASAAAVVIGDTGSAVAALAEGSLPALSPRRLTVGLAAMVLGVGVVVSIAAPRPAPPSPLPVAAPPPKTEPLPPGAVARLGTLRLRTTQPVAALCYSADGKTLATASWAGVQLWDLTTGAERQRPISDLVLSPDGRRLAIVCQQQFTSVMHVWEVAGPKGPRRIRQQAAVRAVAISPDGKVMATIEGPAGSYTTVPKMPARIEDAATGRELALLRCDDDATCLAFSPDGKALAVGYGGGTVRLWDTVTGKETRRLAGHRGTVTSLAFSDDGRLLASGSQDTTVLLWER